MTKALVKGSGGGVLTVNAEALPSISEVWAVAENVLKPHQFKLLQLIYDPTSGWDKTVPGGMGTWRAFEKAGYTNQRTPEVEKEDRFLKYSHQYAEIQRIFGKLEKAGFTRQVLTRILCGPSDAKILYSLDRLIDHEDGKVAVKATETAVKIRGWIEGSKGGVTVNVQNNVNQTNYLPNLDRMLAEPGE